MTLCVILIENDTQIQKGAEHDSDLISRNALQCNAEQMTNQKL